MDPLTQGFLGAAAPQSVGRNKQLATAGVLGFLAGMAPDLDVLIRSDTDPLLFLEFHRHFTHSLVFIPIGGLICGLVLHYLLGRRRGLSLFESCLYCTLGYATHALLDSCTTYGTQLFWPFSDQRFAWNVVSVIDPLYTLPLVLLVVLATVKKRPVFAQVALIWAVAYMGLGVIQRDRAEAVGWELAQQRNHQVIRLEAKPSFANLLVWKLVYETPDKYYVDAVKVGLGTRVYPGQSVARLDVEKDLAWLDPGSQQARDVERFRWFSNGYVALDPNHKNRIIDIRYSMIPNEVEALWSIQLSPQAKSHEHVNYLTNRNTSTQRNQAFWRMLVD